MFVLTFIPKPKGDRTFYSVNPTIHQFPYVIQLWAI
jgi:hypothetical protein